jgi:transcriptional regulator with XRE-family HTH domain
MKKITQKQIASFLNCKQATVSRYLTNTREIKLSDALKVSKHFKVPIEIFSNSDCQIKYFGKSFIISYTKSIPNNQKKAQV